ncbi:MAG: hypothetical protein RL161_498, partial [Bacteroidota bacterium]
MSESRSIFRPGFTKEAIQKTGRGTLAEALGIEITHIGENSITATMPVDHRTIQPMGLLHGGASVALAETVGSISANGTIDHDKQYCVGLEINANHIRGVRSGLVKGTSTALHIGRSTQVWEIKITDEADRLV